MKHVASDPTIGVVANEVYEVADLDATTLQKAPPIGMRWRPEFIAAIAKWKDEFITVPNMKAGERVRGDHRSVEMTGGNPSQKFEPNSDREIGDLVSVRDALKLNLKARARARADVAEA